MNWSDVNAIYQIYPRSFLDTNGDGTGDLKGITQKLGYLKGEAGSLGVDAIWISPFFKSPMKDFGYDVADYCQVDPVFGSMADFDELISEAHRREIKVMIDYVPNHSSDQHSWFLESRSSRENDKRDWYIWRDAKPDGSPPNNWRSVFGGSAWEFDETTGQYYLHSFLASQPDLNWANPEVRKAMTDVLHFWLSKGVDGIRADAVRWISKDSQMRDNPPNYDYRPGEEDPYHAHIQLYSRYSDHYFDYLKIIADTVDQYDDRIIVFEDYPDSQLPEDRYTQYKRLYEVNPRVAAPFNFDGLHLEYDPDVMRQAVNQFQSMVEDKYRPFYCFGNHDKPRLASRVGLAPARGVGFAQLTLPGIPVIYYGEEIGMQDVAIAPDIVKDPFEIQTPGLGLGRDPNRTPMQWSDDHNAGFSPAEPWLPLADNYRAHNVVTESGDEDSLLAMYRQLLKLRRRNVIRNGRYLPWNSSNQQLFGYIRQDDQEQLLVALNMSARELEWQNVPTGEVIYSTHGTTKLVDERLVLAPHQGVVIALDGPVVG